MSEMLGLLPEFIVLGAALLIPIIYPKANARDGHKPALLALLAVVVAGGLLFGAFGDLGALDVVPEDGTVLNFYELSIFSALLKLVFLAGTAAVIIASPRYIGDRALHGEYHALLLLATLGGMIVASSTDFITLFIGIEITSFASYVLAGWFRRSEASLEASMKYFITGALASTLALYGITLLYGLTGSVTFDGLLAYWQTFGPQVTAVARDPLLVLSMFLVLAGLGFKMTVAPFHMWAPDVYAGAPDTISAFLGGVSKAVGAVALIRVFLIALGPVEAGWAAVVAILAIATMTLGNLVAIKQDNIKRMLAYSSVAQAGYLLIVLPIGTELAIAGGLFHAGVNVLMKGGAFLVVAALAAGGVGYRIADYNGLARRNPIIALSLTVFLLSLAGIPPLAGFASKFVLFSSAVEGGVAEAQWVWWLAVAGIVNSAISLYYYARWIRAMYFEAPTMHPVRAKVPIGASIAVALSLTGVVLFGLFPQVALEWSLRAAAVLLGGAAP